MPGIMQILFAPKSFEPGIGGWKHQQKRLELAAGTSEMCLVAMWHGIPGFPRFRQNPLDKMKPVCLGLRP